MNTQKATKRIRDDFLFVIVLGFLLGCFLQFSSEHSGYSQERPESERIQTRDAIPATVKNARDTPGVPIGPSNIIRTEVDLALVNVTVTDPFDRIVVGLDQDNFRVFEDGVEQEVIVFSTEDIPASVGIIFDLSGSMKNKIGRSRAAIAEFVKTANKQDEFFLVGFNNHAELMSPFTDEPELIESRLLATPPRDGTALLDAIYLGLGYVRNAKYRKRALLIFSDGGDNHSRHSKREIKQLVTEADVQLYAIGFYNPLGYPYQTPEELHGPSLLEEITEMTGGQVFPGEHVEDLHAIAAKIGRELRNQYVLGYKPSNHNYDGGWRKIKVKLRPPWGAPPLLVHAKSGYYANTH